MQLKHRVMGSAGNADASYANRERVTGEMVAGCVLERKENIKE